MKTRKQKQTSSALPRPSWSSSYYTFRNMDGQTTQLRGDLTVEDLVRMGYRDIRLVQPETPLKPHEWRADSISENAKTDPLHGRGKTQPEKQDDKS